VSDLSDSVAAPSVLEGYETDLARQLNRSVRTLQRLAARQSGPPRIKIGRMMQESSTQTTKEDKKWKP
jgi:hypothetical protein